MNRAQRRLHRHHRPARLPEVMLPAFARGAIPRAEGSRVHVDLAPGGFTGTAALPAGTRGWLLVSTDDAVPAPCGWATLRVDRPARGDWHRALVAAAVWLRALPETRGLPLALAGAGEGGRTAAAQAAAALGREATALLLDDARAGVVVLTPTTVVGPRDAEACGAALAGLGAPSPGPNHRARRRLAHGLERSVRRDVRRSTGGALPGRVRAGIALLAAALATGLAVTAAAPAGAAFTTTYAGGGLKVNGDGANDSIIVDCGVVTGQLQVNGATVTDGPLPVSCSDVTAVLIDGGAGDDTLRGLVDGGSFPGPASGSVEINGGSDDDLLEGFFAGSTQLDGDAGNDSLIGASTATTLVGDGGNDTLDGNSLADTALFPGAATVNVDLAAGTAVATGGGAGSDTLSGITTVTGTAGADTLTGSAAAELLLGNAGTDLLSGGAGADTLVGGTEDDRLRPGADSDSVDGGAGADRIEETLPGAGTLEVRSTSLTGNGTDTLTSIERASLQGSSAADQLSALLFNGPVTLSGANGDDTLQTSVLDHDDQVLGSGGDDLLIGSVNNQSVLTSTQLTGGGTDALSSIERASISGGNSDDTMSALTFPGAVTLSGGNFNDSLRAGPGPTLLEGGNGDDTLEAGAGPATISGGNATDRLNYTRDADQTLTNAGVSSTAADASITGSTEAVSLRGGAAGNVLNASAYTGENVTLDGGGGDDTVTGPAGVAADLRGNGDDDTLTGGSGDDTLDGGADDDHLLGGSGEDTLSGGADPSQVDTLSGGPDADLLHFSARIATLDGGAGTDTLATSLGNQVSITDTAFASDAPANASLQSVEAHRYTGSGLGQLIDLSGLTVPATVDGGGGDDTVVAAAAAADDDLSGGPGTDELRRTADADQTLTPTQLTGGGTDVISEFERAALTGGAADNTLDARTFAGPVTLSGEGGDDVLFGGLGADNLLGGPGADNVDSRDGGIADTIDCGADVDALLSDAVDAQTGCETVNGVDPSAPPAAPPATPPAVAPAPLPAAGTTAAPTLGDTTAPRLKLTGSRTQRAGTTSIRIKVAFSCDEACTTTAAGTITATRRVKVKGKTRTRKTKLRLKTVRATTTRSGQRKTLTLKLSKKQTRTLLRLLRSRTTRKVSIPVKLTATDTAGNRAKSSTRTVRITKPKSKKKTKKRT